MLNGFALYLVVDGAHLHFLAQRSFLSGNIAGVVDNRHAESFYDEDKSRNKFREEGIREEKDIYNKV